MGFDKNGRGVRGSTSAKSSSPDSTAMSLHMADELCSLFDSGKYSDLVIQCGGRRWNVHRAVVCMQSKPIAAAFDGGFMEASNGVFTLQEEDPVVVQLLLKFMYTGGLDIELPLEPVAAASSGKPQQDNFFSVLSHSGYLSPDQFSPMTNGYLYPSSPTYPTHLPLMNSFPSYYTHPQLPHTTPNASNHRCPHRQYPPDNTDTGVQNPEATSVPPSSSSDNDKHLAKGLLTSTQVYILADKYDVSPLKTIACNIYQYLSKSFWDTEEFLQSLTMIFDGTPDTTSETDKLRLTASKETFSHVKELLDRPCFKELFEERGDIATAVLKASLASSGKSDSYQGPHNGMCYF